MNLKLLILILTVALPLAAYSQVDDPVISVSKDDKEMNAAISRAKSEVDTFIVVLNSKAASFYSIKVPITDKYRPVFAADSSHGKISPNLAGRMAAAFALGYQVFKTSDPVYAQKLLHAAQHIYDLAATENVTALTSTCPHDFYPEDHESSETFSGADPSTSSG